MISNLNKKPKLIKAFIIGCGNIGAMYDYYSKSIKTYAKAFHLDSDIIFDVYDTNYIKAMKVAKKYNVKAITELKKELICNYDIVAISSPTSTHYHYLKLLIKEGVKLIICEKPISHSRTQINHLLKLYNAQSKSKILVNLFRRYQPNYLHLRQYILKNKLNTECTNIVVKYQRGFHNNCIHALDLLEFLFDKKFKFKKPVITNIVPDEFQNDPTVSLFSKWRDTNIQVVGLSHIQYSHFEIELYFGKQAILIKEGGKNIEYHYAQNKTGNYYPVLKLRSTQNNAIDNYMVAIIKKAKDILNDKTNADNFVSAANISKEILSLINYE